MPRCEVKWLKGRSMEQQNAIAEKLTDAFVEVLNCPRRHVTVVFRETDPANYYTGGISEAQEMAAKEN
ncbi:MAG: 4-oxalocrotonate tautomerase family protein [Oscillospiraceae bacterium]|nr:4-oxalocrotonate tautomerase family protein [Oscillospiraceae bacterium]